LVDRPLGAARLFCFYYENDGIRVDAALSRELQGRYRAYITP
jgi:hypothetical protein